MNGKRKVQGQLRKAFATKVEQWTKHQQEIVDSHYCTRVKKAWKTDKSKRTPKQQQILDDALREVCCDFLYCVNYNGEKSFNKNKGSPNQYSCVSKVKKYTISMGYHTPEKQNLLRRVLHKVEEIILLHNNNLTKPDKGTKMIGINSKKCIYRIYGSTFGV